MFQHRITYEREPTPTSESEGSDEDMVVPSRDCRSRNIVCDSDDGEADTRRNTPDPDPSLNRPASRRSDEEDHGSDGIFDGDAPLEESVPTRRRTRTLQPTSRYGPTLSQIMPRIPVASASGSQLVSENTTLRAENERLRGYVDSQDKVIKALEAKVNKLQADFDQHVPSLHSKFDDLILAIRETNPGVDRRRSPGRSLAPDMTNSVLGGLFDDVELRPGSQPESESEPEPMEEMPDQSMSKPQTPINPTVSPL
ncbi:hypothetical protein ACKRZS_003352 [Fusarium odoratissimum]